ncbi:MAG: hypothetical protein QM639_04495 [Rhodocyclaceae bacterium]
MISMLARAAAEPLRARRYKLDVIIPERFSVIDDPTGSLTLITGFAAILRSSSRKIQRIFIDHGRLREYDLAANGLLAVIVSDLREERAGGRRLRLRGRYPADPSVRRVYEELAITKYLNIETVKSEASTEPSLEVFDVRRAASIEPEGVAARYHEQKAGEFVEHVDRCLVRGSNRRLTATGKLDLSNYVAEILANAEDHAIGRYGHVDWSIQGYLDESAKPASCEITIFNFGPSFAQTLNLVPRDGFTWIEQVRPYLDRHAATRNNSGRFREEELLTVIALQGGVSSKNDVEETTRGQGTVDLIRFFQAVHAECNGATGCGAEMAIISGSTYVKFDGTYKMEGQQSTTSVIAFNRGNTLEAPPDPKYVQSLGRLSFPGTIISIRFPLSSASSRLVEERNNGGSDEN